eukprot:1773271-Amphidinium_carterae.1
MDNLLAAQVGIMLNGVASSAVTSVESGVLFFVVVRKIGGSLQWGFAVLSYPHSSPRCPRFVKVGLHKESSGMESRTAAAKVYVPCC